MGLPGQRSRYHGGRRTARGFVAPATLLLAVAPLFGADAPGAPGASTRIASSPAFPEFRPATRAQALGLLEQSSSHERSEPSCLTPSIELARQARYDPSFATGPASSSVGRATIRALSRAVELLEHRTTFPRERTAEGPDGMVIRFTAAVDAADRVHGGDEDGDGLPDLVQATLDGIASARTFLVDGLGLEAPADLELLLVRLDGQVRGYMADARTIVLDASADSTRFAARAAAHQYAHAVARVRGAELAAGWSESFAFWVSHKLGSFEEMTRDRGEVRTAFEHRLASMSRGLLDERLDLAAGNALWFEFLDARYGPVAVRSTLDELSRGGSPALALDRGVRRVTPDSLAEAFREFHLWTVLVGDRADTHHFGFAPRLSSPRFASVVEGLPALSVQADAAVAPLGSAQVRLTPAADRGGMRLLFEGELAARWEADLLLVGADSALRRVPLSLSHDGRGEITVPLGDVAEAWLLVRNMGSEEGAAHRYTYSAHREEGFPFELEGLQAEAQDGDDGDDGAPMGVLVSWQTATEQRLVGFNVIRRRLDDSTPVVVNPVWVPALGDESNSTSYHYLDRSVEPGVEYEYQVQGITRDGLTSSSDSVIARTARPGR
jgi:hypothetical protein